MCIYIHIYNIKIRIVIHSNYFDKSELNYKNSSNNLQEIMKNKLEKCNGTNRKPNKNKMAELILNISIIV